MAEKIRGKGVISGIAMGKIMLAGQNLDGYLVSYQPEDKETEKSKAKAALTAVAEQLREGIEKMQKNEKTKDTSEPAAPASAIPTAKLSMLTKLTFTPRSSAASRFWVVARIA